MKLGQLTKKYRELTDGTYEQLVLTNRQYAFARRLEHSEIIVALNNDDNSASMEIPIQNYPNMQTESLIGEEEFSVKDGKLQVQLPANRGVIIYVAEA